jgi:hypothetical protein
MHGPVPLLQVVWLVHIHIWTKIAQPVVHFEHLGRLTFKACGLSVTFQVYWPMGLHISVWASTLASSGLAGAYLYLDVRIKWTKIVIVAHISDWDSSTFI